MHPSDRSAPPPAGWPGLPPAAPPARPRRGLVLGLGLLLGVVVGAVAVGVVWFATSSASDGDPAAEDAQGACAALERFSVEEIQEFYAQEGDTTEQEQAAARAQLSRLSAAMELSRAAADTDTEFQPLFDALEEARQRFVVRFEFDDPEALARVDEARDFCAGI